MVKGFSSGTSAMYAFIKRIRNDQHTRRYTIRPTPDGWEVRAEQDSRTVERACYHDWRRAEIARRMFTIELANLKLEGWREESSE